MEQLKKRFFFNKDQSNELLMGEPIENEILKKGLVENKALIGEQISKIGFWNQLVKTNHSWVDQLNIGFWKRNQLKTNRLWVNRLEENRF